MSKDVNIEILMPVENFVVYKNKIRKEMSETPAEDLEAYKKFEWERAKAWWGFSWNNIKNDRMDENLLIQVRDLLGYSWETYPLQMKKYQLLIREKKKKDLLNFRLKWQKSKQDGIH